MAPSFLTRTLGFLLVGAVLPPTLAQDSSAPAEASISSRPQPLFPTEVPPLGYGCSNCTATVTEYFVLTFTIPWSTLPTTASETATSTTSSGITWDLSGLPEPSSLPTPSGTSISTTSSEFTWDLSGFWPTSSPTTVVQPTINSTTPSSTFPAAAPSNSVEPFQSEDINDGDNDDTESEDFGGQGEDAKPTSSSGTVEFSFPSCSVEGQIICGDDNAYDRCSRIVRGEPLVWTHHDLQENQLCADGKLYGVVAKKGHWRG